MKEVRQKNSHEVVDALIELLRSYSVHTITCDNGKEFADQHRMAHKLKAKVFFANIYAARERGANENGNGLSRQYFPKDSDFIQIDNEYIGFVFNQLNSRLRKWPVFDAPFNVMINSSRCI